MEVTDQFNRAKQDHKKALRSTIRVLFMDGCP